jgi:thiamine-monophosphate kinase
MNKLPPILGEEFQSINKIIGKNSFTKIGDDCAIITHPGNSKILYSIDAFIEDVHFKTSYFSPFEIGYKAVQASISDIAAMGGSATHCLLSLSVPSKDLISAIIKGVKESLSLYRVELIGGDTTYGKKIAISVCVIGKTNGRPIMRSGAKIKDLLYVTGYTGLSGAGLYALHKKIKGYTTLKNAQKKPVARLDIAKKLSKIASSMIDISDGLSSEIIHLCHQSNVSARLYNIPLHPELVKFCKKQKLNPETFALNGGEDYELLYTIPPVHKKKAIGFCIGEIIKKSVRSSSVTPDVFKHF